MKSRYVYSFLLMLLSFQFCNAVQLKKVHSHEYDAFEQSLKSVCINSFYEIYKTDWNDEFNIQVQEIFDDYMHAFKTSDNTLLIVAHDEDQVIGWILFYLEKNHDRAIIELVTVDPLYWRKGIGKLLVFSLFDYYPETKSIAVISRKINAISPHFYQSLGFKATDYMVPKYTSATMQGYELFVND